MLLAGVLGGKLHIFFFCATAHIAYNNSAVGKKNGAVRRGDGNLYRLLPGVAVISRKTDKGTVFVELVG